MVNTRVLVADNDDEFLEILQSYLALHGIQCAMTRSGVDCLAMLRRFEPQVLVLDSALLWGGADGVLARMEDDLKFRQIPVIVTGGHQTEEAQPGEACSPSSNSPSVSHFKKPYSMRQLLRAINSLQKQRPSLEVSR